MLEQARALSEQLEKEDRDRDEFGSELFKAVGCALLSIVFLVATFFVAIMILGFFDPVSPLVQLGILVLWVLSWASGTAVLIYFMLPGARRAVLMRLFRNV